MLEPREFPTTPAGADAAERPRLETTSAVVATGYGGPEVLAVVEVPLAAPGPGEVLVEVRAAGLNPVDGKLYSGAFGTDERNLPMRLGFESSGVVRAAGPDAVGPAGPVAVGDEVIVSPASGGYARHVVAPASSVLPRPKNLSWAEAAGLLTTGGTAVHTLEATRVRSGDTVLVHAAAGGVGLMVVQIAVARGARVIGTASPARHEALRALGAEPVAYGAGLADRVRALAPAGVDAAIDAAGTDEALDVSLELVADRDRIATIVAFDRGAQAGIKVLGNGPGADPGTAVRSAARLDLVRMAEQGLVRVFVDRTFPLAQVQAAHGTLRAGHSRGKLVLLP